MVTKISNNDLSQAKAQGVAVLDFSATWCGPCPSRLCRICWISIFERYARPKKEQFPFSAAGAHCAPLRVGVHHKYCRTL